jgi:hypothetical protein
MDGKDWKVEVDAIFFLKGSALLMNRYEGGIFQALSDHEAYQLQAVQQTAKEVEESIDCLGEALKHFAANP